MRRALVVGATVAVLCATVVTCAGETDAHRRIEPEFFGINGVGYFHYRATPHGHEHADEKMRWLKQAGATTDRADLWWNVVEPKRGEWDWKQADWMMDFYARNHVELFPILSYGAAWSDHSPANAQEVADFASYAANTAARYRGRVRAWEVWNEPNIPTFWKPEPDAAAYSRLLIDTSRAVHKADPTALVVGGASNMADITWIDDLARHDALDAMDVLSFHPYSMADGPEQMDLARQIQNVHHALADHGRPDMPVWITEMGWTSDIRTPSQMEDAANYMVQSYVIAAAEGIQRLYWFNLQDWNEGNHLEGWGMVSPDGKVKQPLLQQYRAIRDQLVDAEYLGCKLLKSSEGVPAGIAYIFRKDAERFAAAWSFDKSGIARLNVGIKDETSVSIKVDSRARFYPLSKDADLAGLLDRTPEKPNPLVNSGFEILDRDIDPRMGKAKPYGWEPGKFNGGHDGALFEVIEGRTSSTHAIALRQTTDSLWQSWPIPALPGESFRLTAKIRTENATGENGVQLNFYGNTGWGDRGGPISSSISGTSRGWKKVQLTGTAPRNADVLRINCVSKNNRGSVAFDDLILTRTGLAERERVQGLKADGPTN